VHARPFKDVANLYLLTNCDMDCTFCYASKDLGLMSVERANSVIDFLRDAGAERINLTGGELLMHPQAHEIVRHAAESGLRVTLFTSGSMLTQRRAERFLPHIDWLALSLDGPPAINVAVGRSERHYDATVNALRLTRALAPDLKIRVASVVTSINVEHLHQLGTLFSDPTLTPDLWRLKQMVPTRRAKEEKDQLGIPQDVFATHMADLLRRHGSKMRIQIHPAASKVADTMCIHPNGAATVTLGDGDDMNIVGLGNMFSDPQRVLDGWWRYRDEDNADGYDAMWALDVAHHD
jgi:MoaA/NifB/PqqE/SkfB family radical SAM enzyme